MMVEPRGLEPLTPCLQSKCATYCAMAPWSLFALVGELSPSSPGRSSSAHTLRCVHCVCDQVSGPVHGVRGNRPDPVTVHVSRNRNRGMAKQLAHHGDVRTGGQHQRCGTVPQAVETHCPQLLTRSFAELLEQSRDVRGIECPAVLPGEGMALGLPWLNDHGSPTVCPTAQAPSRTPVDAASPDRVDQLRPVLAWTSRTTAARTSSGMVLREPRYPPPMITSGRVGVAHAGRTLLSVHPMARSELAADAGRWG